MKINIIKVSGEKNNIRITWIATLHQDESPEAQTSILHSALLKVLGGKIEASKEKPLFNKKKGKTPEKDDSVEYDGMKFNRFKPCKYNCGCFVSFTHYRDKQLILHAKIDLTSNTYIPLGYKCPKYDEDLDF